MQQHYKKTTFVWLISDGLTILPTFNAMFSSCKVTDLSRSSRVKSKMAPHLKLNFMVYGLICTMRQF